MLGDNGIGEPIDRKFIIKAMCSEHEHAYDDHHAVLMLAKDLALPATLRCAALTAARAQVERLLGDLSFCPECEGDRGEGGIVHAEECAIALAATPLPARRAAEQAEEFVRGCLPLLGGPVTEFAIQQAIRKVQAVLDEYAALARLAPGGEG